MSDDPVRTRLRTQEGWLDFQDYFVRLRCKPVIDRLDYAGAKLRSKFVTPPGFDEHFRFGINLEVSLLPRAFDASRWGAEVRPIAAWESERWLFAINPDLSGSPDSAPAFEPGAMAKVKVAGLALGVEYFGAPSEREHYLFGAVDVLSWEGIELNLAAGKGLTVVLIVGFGLGALYWGLVLWRGAPGPATVTTAPGP